EIEEQQADLTRKEAAWLASLQPAAGGQTLPESPEGTTPPAARAAAEAGRLRSVRDAVRNRLAQEREALAGDTERESSLARQIEDLEAAAAQDALTAARTMETAAAARQELAAAEDAERQAAGAVMEREAVAREAVQKAQGLLARAAALQLALDEVHARAGVEHLSGRAGVLGTLLDVVEIDDGCELAFEAAVAEAVGLVVVEGDGHARAAIEHLRASGLTGGILSAALAPASGQATVGDVATDRPDLLRRVVRPTTPGVGGLIDRLLDGVVLCRGDLGSALELIAELPEGSVVVTLEGDRFSARGWRLGAGRAGATKSALEVVRLESILAEQEADEATAAAESARQAHAEARTAARGCARTFEAASAEERQSRTQREQVAQRCQLLRQQAPAVARRRSERSTAVGTLEGELAQAEEQLSAAEDLERRLAEAAEQTAAARHSLDTEARALADKRSAIEVQVSALLERRDTLARRREEIEARLVGYEAARSEASERRQGHEAARRALERLAAAVSRCLEELASVLAALQQRRQAHVAAVSGLTARLAEARSARSGAEAQMAEVHDKAQRTELELAELRVRIESSIETIRHDLEVEPAVAKEADCPEVPQGTSPAARARDLEREIRLLGPVNPLALEELAGVEERDRFLGGQIEDVKSARRDLTRVIKAVDEEIVSVFAQAFEDVNRHFEGLFATLFPGGTGRLMLIDPADMLGTGIEIEARPAGRNARRLSLLSGGERSLVALAFLFAVFRSRPSPFYLMDEVEAALDDINLHRFLDLVDEFRSEAQLLIVSHQKRTMESADILYGVSLQPGGASKVVTERLRSDSARTG
ncbi:MAG TPA: hypothetical protein VGP46_09460, partial [Acidimicrobiales bacterium]|nr:hypothetical protein [Acidimicrobiales bacterium]